MKKITLLIMLLFSIASFSQEQVILDIDRLLNLNNGYLRVSSKTQYIYDSYGAQVTHYGMVINLAASDFPLTLSWKYGLTNGGCTTQTHTYTYEDYENGKHLGGGCAPEYFYIISPHKKLSATKGVCENINLPVSTKYSINNGQNWNLLPNNSTAASLLGANFRGTILFKYNVDSFYADPKVTMESKVFTYTIIGCPPKLDTNVPPVSKEESCYGKNDGEVTFTFDRPLETSPEERFLFTYNPVGENIVTSVYSNDVRVEKLSPLQYKLKGIKPGIYNFKYQTIVGTTAPNPSSDVVGPNFTINPKTELKFLATAIQPKCSTDKGGIQITASGGTPDYFYNLNGETEIVNGVTIPKRYPFSTLSNKVFDSGKYTIIVSDANNCLAVPQDIEINSPPTAITITGKVVNETGPDAKNGKIILDATLAGSPSYDLVCTNGTETIPLNQLTALSAGTYVITSTNNLQCTNASATFLVRQEITCAVTTTNLNCFGATDGTVTLDVKGGSGNYSVSWKDSSNTVYNPASSITTNNNTYKYTATGLPPGTYTFTIKDTEVPSSPIISFPLKEYTNSRTISQPQQAFTVANPTINQPAPGIDNGSILINASFGYGNYTYSWTKDGNVFTPSLPQSPDYPKGLGNGRYYVTVTDKNPSNPNGIGCSITKGPFDLKALNVIITPPTPITCQGSTTNLTSQASGGEGTIDFKWFELTGNNPVVENELTQSSSLNNIKAGTYKVTATDSYNTASATIVIQDSTNPIITATISQTPVTCFSGSDGKANIKIKNAVANTTYIFKWYKITGPQTLVELTDNIVSTQAESTKSGLTEGSYTVTVSNGFCLESFPVTITSATPIVVQEESGGFKNLKCFGDNNGSIAISATGGTGPYTYFWKKNGSLITVNNDLNPTLLGAGIYSVEVHTNYDINNPNPCFSVLGNIIITSPNELKFTYTTTDITCKNSGDGTIQLDITGGTVQKINNKPIYKISSNAEDFGAVINIPNQKITGLGVGIWDINVSDDNNCVIAAQQIEIKEPAMTFSFGTETITNVTGNGLTNGSIQLNNTGGWGNYSYKWYTGQTVDNNELITNEESDFLENKPAGKYTVVATDKNNNNLGCSLPAISFEIKEPAILTLDVNATNAKCNAGQGSIIAIAKGGTEITQNQSDRQYTYELFLNNVSKQTIVGNTANFTGLVIGQYKVIAKDSKGNISTIANTNYKNGVITTIGYVELTEPTPILVTEATTGIKKALHCFDNKDGILSISVSGGTPFPTGASYNYVWKKLNTATLIYEPIGTNDSKQSNLSDGTYSVEVHDANYSSSSPSACTGTLENIIITKPEKLAFTYTKENVYCFGGANGTIQLNITGGTKNTDIAKPYTIYSNGGTIDNQNGIVSGLTAGTYTIKVADGNLCETEEQTIIIGEPINSVYVVNHNSTPTTGFGLATGKIEITVAGGTSGYKYLWKNNSGSVVGTNSPTLSNAIAGTYTVLVTDAKGCPVSGSYKIEEPSKPILSQTHLQSKCNGLLGSLEAVANGGASFNQNQSNKVYTYKLKNKTSGITTTITGNIASFANIADGNYSLTATDISGVDSNTIDVQFAQPTSIIVSLASKSNVRCFGDQDGAIAISVSGGTPLLVNGNPEYSYQWKKKNTATNNYENFTPTSLNALSYGIYAVEVRDANYNAGDATHCIGILENIEITQPADFGFDIDKITYTNPSANGNDGSLHFEITGGKSNYEYKFYTKNATGNETVINTVSNSGAKTVDFIELIKDHYYISAKDDTGCIKYADFDFRDNPLIASISQTQNITCHNANNGVLTITTEGGFGTKTISWYRNNILLSTNTLTDQNLNLLNVQPGNYYAVIKDFKKVEVISNIITVFQPAPIVFSMTQEPIKCIGESNGKITLKASGGNGNFRYRYSSKNILIKDWQNFSNGVTTVISDLAEGEYSIDVIDTQQCTSANATIKIISPTALTIINTSSVPATGYGLSNGSVSITAQGSNGGYTYNWFKSDNTNINQITNTAVNLPAGKYYVIITDNKGCNLTSPLLEVTEPPLLETSISVQNGILCNGDKNGSLKPTTIGGLLKPGDNYTYKWYENGNAAVLGTSTILNNIGIGSYYVIAVDSNGNEAKSQILLVTQPEILDNTLTSDYTLCGDANDWTIDATPSGGTAPYTYIWNNGIKTASLSNVPPANYSVLVTDNHGCSITKNITITTPIHLAAAESITIPTCFGGADATIEIISSGGKAPYTYLWNTGEKSNVLKNAAAGDYSVTITDSKGCIINHNYTIVNPPKDVINLGQDVTLCFDQTLTINAAINDDKATYVWTSDKGFSSNKAMITISEPANYTVIVTNKLGCEATDTIKISSQNTAISAEFAMSSQVFKNEKIVIVDISNPIADEIEWILPANATIVNKNKDYAEISFSEIGQYDITINTKKGNCTAFQTKQILVTEGEFEENNPDENEPEKKFDLKIYPNPSKGIFTVDVKLDKIMPANVKVYNLNNNLLIDSKSESGKDNYLFNFSLSGLPAGLYFVLFESQQGSKLRKIIIQ